MGVSVLGMRHPGLKQPHLSGRERGLTLGAGPGPGAGSSWKLSGAMEGGFEQMSTVATPYITPPVGMKG